MRCTNGSITSGCWVTWAETFSADAEEPAGWLATCTVVVVESVANVLLLGDCCAVLHCVVSLTVLWL